MYCFVIIPSWLPQHLPYSHPLVQSLRQVKRFNTMPTDASSHVTDLSNPSSNNDGNSTKFTGSSDKSRRRSEAPEGPTLAERVFDVYKARGIAK